MNKEYKLEGKYEQGQTPQERLSNLLSPFFTLADIINTEQFNSSDSNIKKEAYNLVKRQAKICLENKELVRKYLKDIAIFYSNSKS